MTRCVGQQDPEYVWNLIRFRGGGSHDHKDNRSSHCKFKRHSQEKHRQSAIETSLFTTRTWFAYINYVNHWYNWCWPGYDQQN